MNKRYLKRVIFVLSFVLFTFSSINTVVFAKDSPPQIAAENAVLMDGTTGEILYSKKPNEVFPPASTTKLMTALLTLENCKLEDKVIVGKNPPFADGSRAGIMEKEELTVKDLLYGLLFVSGNDCANALAEHIGGSVENFAAMMNKRADELGLKSTNFVNPNGLYDPKHKSTVKDLALIMKVLVKHPEYSVIASDNKTYYITASNNNGIQHPVSNEIQMVWKGGKYYYEGIEGGKTGYTVQSLFSYVVSAQRNGQRLIVALHSSSKNHYSDSIKLLNYGFKNFELTKLYSKGEKVSDYKINDKLTIPLLAADDFYYVKEKGSTGTPQVSLNSKNLEYSPFSRGDMVLDANITLNDQNFGNIKLVSGSDYILESAPASAASPAGTPGKSNAGLVIKILINTLLGFICVILLLRTIIKRKRLRKSRHNIREWNKYL